MTKKKKDNSMDDEVFILKVEKIVYSILQNRELTIPEVKKMEEAIRTSLEIIINKRFTQHLENVSLDKTQFKNEIIDDVERIISLAIDAYDNEREKKIHNSKKRAFGFIILIATIAGAISATLQLLLS